MVIIELIASISLAIAFVSALALLIIHIKNKQINKTFNNIQQSDKQIDHLQKENYQSSSAAIIPFEEINLQKQISIINNEEYSSSPIKYGIQWTIPTNDGSQTERTNSSSNNLLKTSEFDQGDSLSFSDQTTSVRNLIKKFETNSRGKISRKEKNNQLDLDLTSIDTNFDNQTIKTDRNQNKQKFSYHSSISNLDITIPSNLSSSIDLEQFECFSTTSNLSEYLNK